MANNKGKAKAKAPEDDSPGSDLKIANSLKLRHILCEKHSKSVEALEKLKAGEKFDVVATNYSEDKARHGGSLGWMTRAGMMGAFQDVCFSMPVSTCAAPIYREIKTKHGYQCVLLAAQTSVHSNCTQADQKISVLLMLGNFLNSGEQHRHCGRSEVVENRVIVGT